MKNKFEIGERALLIPRVGEPYEVVIRGFSPYNEKIIFSSSLSKWVECKSKYLYDIGESGVGYNGKVVTLLAEEDFLRKIHKPSSQSFNQIIDEIKSTKPVEV